MGRKKKESLDRAYCSEVITTTKKKQQRGSSRGRTVLTAAGHGGQKTMESASAAVAATACQVKGCKVNKRSARHHDSYVAKENNNLNSCSDEENVDEQQQLASSKQHGGKKNQSAKAALGSNSSSSNNNNNNSNAKSNNNRANKPESGGKSGVSSSKSPSKPTTPDLTYSKVVSNSILANYDCIKIPPISIPKVSVPMVGAGPVLATTTTTTTTTTNGGGGSSSSSSSSSDSSNADEQTTNNVINQESNKLAPQQQQQQQQQQQIAAVASNNNHEKKKTATSNGNKDAEAQQRRAVLSYEQVCRLNDVMNEVVSIHGRGNFPTLEVRLRDLVRVVKGKLEADPSQGGAGMRVRDIRLNGGAASHVLATESQPYNDLDLIFGVELSSGRNYDKVKAAVLGSLFDLLPEGVSRKRITTCSLKEAYVSKMVKVSNDGDRWSLISLGNSRGHRNVELKFVDSMRRQFEFSVDSFQIVLDSLLQHRQEQPEELGPGQGQAPAPLDESSCPEVVGESVYGDFHEALYHLQKKLISTRHPEEIRGGGLLKYCNLLVKMYKPAQPDYIKTLERYMCSRFFIDFPDIGQQKAKLENYLWNHFAGAEEEALKYQYLMLLHSVVEESTVCLMGHERRQTLALIESLAYQVLCQEQQRLTNHQAPAPAYLYANGYYYAPVIPTACYTCTCNSWMACSS